MTDSNFANHRREQVLRWAFQTTATQRLQFVEDLLEFTHEAGCDYQKTKRELSKASNKKLSQVDEFRK